MPGDPLQIVPAYPCSSFMKPLISFRASLLLLYDGSLRSVGNVYRQYTFESDTSYPFFLTAIDRFTI